jgi:DNA replication and repair protein RecF
MTMRYRCTVQPRDEPREGAPSRDTLDAAFRDALERRRRREEDLGSTLTGPHRDDLALRLVRDDGHDVDLRDFGSGGQRRTAAVALRLVEADTIRARREREPIVLLDDIFAELDTDRSRRLMALLADERPGQLLVTAPKEIDLGRDMPLERWGIAAGEIAT